MAMNNGRRTSGSFRALNPPLAACHGCSKPHSISLNAPACREVWTEWRRIWTDMNYLSQGWTQVPHWRSEVCGVELAGNRVKSKCNTIRTKYNRSSCLQPPVIEAISHISATLCLQAFSWSGTSLRNGVRASLGQHRCFHYLDHCLSKISPRSHKERLNYPPLSCQNTAVLQKELPIEGPLAMKVRHLLQWTWTNMCTGSWFNIEFINSFPTLLGRLAKLQTKKYVTL